MTIIEYLQGTKIDQDEDGETKGAKVSGLNFFIVNKKIIQLKYNILPRGFVPLERLFNSNDVVVSLDKIP